MLRGYRRYVTFQKTGLRVVSSHALSTGYRTPEGWRVAVNLGEPKDNTLKQVMPASSSVTSITN